MQLVPSFYCLHLCCIYCIQNRSLTWWIFCSFSFICRRVNFQLTTNLWNYCRRWREKKKEKRMTCHADFRCTIYLNSRPIVHTAAFQMHTEGKKKARPTEIIERTLLFMLKQMFKVSVGDWRRRSNSSSCEIWLSAVLQSVRWKDQYHSHICTLNMKLQPAA